MVSGPPRGFVCGHPIAHSRSPRIHRYWLEELGLPGSYDPVDIAPEDLADFLRSIATGTWTGGNMTIPHKEETFRLVERRDRAAERIGAVNTLWLEAGELTGGNTDAYGFAANLDDHAPDWQNADSALVLGAGGAARAVVHALQEAGIPKIRIANRTAARAEDLASALAGSATGHPWSAVQELLSTSDLLVNTTSLGMAGQPALDVNLDALPERAIVADIVYAPLETPLLRHAREKGLVAVDGLGMLLHQAVPGFERWFGKKPVVSAALRAHIVADLETSR